LDWGSGSDWDWDWGSGSDWDWDWGIGFGLGLGLEFEEEIYPQPAILQAQPPDHVLVALLLVFADVAAVDVLQRGEVGFLDPFARRPVAQEVAYHLRMREEELVVAVVRGAHLSFFPSEFSTPANFAAQVIPARMSSFGWGRYRSTPKTPLAASSRRSTERAVAR
jgi:hypothetical protein